MTQMTTGNLQPGLDENPERVMVVTGASAGIGRAVAELALARGWHVAGLSRRAGPEGVLSLECDVSCSEQVDAAVARTAEEWGRVDVVFANAGLFPSPALIDEMTDAEWRSAMSVNLDGMMYAARAGFRQMRSQTPQGGRIIFNGSVSAQAPRPLALPYTVAKHAITGMTRQLALDGRAFGIAAGQIDIGNVRTDLSAQLGRGTLQADGSMRAEPMMELAHVADAVMQMAELPRGANVLNMTLMASDMPLVGRG